MLTQCLNDVNLIDIDHALAADSVVIGELHGSSLLSDETRSTLNALVTARIQSGAVDASSMNFVEINNVCDGGKELHDILKSLWLLVPVYQ